MTAPDNLKNIRTLEDVAYLLNILFTNLNNLDALYYNMFINPEPMTLELERYNENGELVNVTLNNRAKDRAEFGALSGAGSPIGTVSANVGALYIDTLTSYIYYKSSGVSSEGWILIWSANNMIEGETYLSPSGKGDKLTDLNANNITAGTLAVKNGGTGVNAISGIIKGNGSNAFTQAVDGVDYLGPNTFTGMIAYFPVLESMSYNVPDGWLRLDGKDDCSRTTYANLFNVIGTTYGAIDDDHFSIPDARGLFIRCWDTGREALTIEDAAVGTHSHSLSGCTTLAGTPHLHTVGTLDLQGTFAQETSGTKTYTTGVFSIGKSISAASSEPGGSTDQIINFKAAGNWKGAMDTESAHTHRLTGFTANNADDQENMVKNIAFIPMIKY